jgi:hypothetical protein
MVRGDFWPKIKKKKEGANKSGGLNGIFFLTYSHRILYRSAVFLVASGHMPGSRRT